LNIFTFLRTYILYSLHYLVCIYELQYRAYPTNHYATIVVSRLDAMHQYFELINKHENDWSLQLRIVFEKQETEKN